MHITKNHARFAYLSLRDYLSIAFSVPIHQVSGPEWINSARFDIAATMPEHATDADFPKMMEALLRDRFKLQAHRESRESPVLALEVAGGDVVAGRVTEDVARDVLGPHVVGDPADHHGQFQLPVHGVRRDGR